MRIYLLAITFLFATTSFSDDTIQDPHLDEKSNVSEIITQDQAKVLLRKSGCMACHAIDKARIGPAYNEIAKRYNDPKKVDYLKGQDPVEYLMAKVRKGTRKDNRHWEKSVDGKKYGVMTPASPGRISDENLEKLIRYILNLK